MYGYIPNRNSLSQDDMGDSFRAARRAAA
jgi:hypothetical protein